MEQGVALTRAQGHAGLWGREKGRGRRPAAQGLSLLLAGSRRMERCPGPRFYVYTPESKIAPNTAARGDSESSRPSCQTVASSRRATVSA